jgi:hypothetical protein
MDLWREKTRRRIEKENEMDQLVETPVEVSPPKNQQVITHFFVREEALERMKLLASQDQRSEGKGPQLVFRDEELARRTQDLKIYRGSWKLKGVRMLPTKQEECPKKRKKKQRLKGRMKRIRKEHRSCTTNTTRMI